MIWPDEGSVYLSVSEEVSVFNMGEKVSWSEKRGTVLRKGCQRLLVTLLALKWQLAYEQNREGIKMKNQILSGFPQSSTRAAYQKIIL